MKNPIAKALRVKPQQVIPDKRISDDLAQLYNDTLDEETPPEWAELLKKLR